MADALKKQRPSDRCPLLVSEHKNVKTQAFFFFTRHLAKYIYREYLFFGYKGKMGPGREWCADRGATCLL